ncbi:hypothetical protein BD769DRAFT_1383163 [Suillus cothurnatus]|nr:hypothetical protein BD769DRAFT_1383163 [Suillus cothurnatus]
MENPINTSYDLANAELKKPTKGVSIVRLQSLLELALTGESASRAADCHRRVIGSENGEGVPDEEVKVKKDRDRKKDGKKPMSERSLASITKDKSLAASCAKPLSSSSDDVVGRSGRSGRECQRSWRSSRSPGSYRSSIDRAASSRYRGLALVPLQSVPLQRLRVALLRARMLAFVQQILAFAIFQVLEPNWRELEAKLAKVTTGDQLLGDHVDFLDMRIPA